MPRGRSGWALKPRVLETRYFYFTFGSNLIAFCGSSRCWGQLPAEHCLFPSASVLTHKTLVQNSHKSQTFQITPWLKTLFYAKGNWDCIDPRDVFITGALETIEQAYMHTHVYIYTPQTYNVYVYIYTHMPYTQPNTHTHIHIPKHTWTYMILPNICNIYMPKYIQT